MITLQKPALTSETQINNHTTGFPLVSAGEKGAFLFQFTQVEQWDLATWTMEIKEFLSISMPHVCSIRYLESSWMSSILNI